MFDRPLSDKARSRLITADLSTLPGRTYDQRRVGIWFDYGPKFVQVKQTVGKDGARLIHQYTRRSTGCRVLLLNALSLLPNGVATSVVTCHFRDRFEYEQARKKALANALKIAGSAFTKVERKVIWDTYFSRTRTSGKEGATSSTQPTVRVAGFRGQLLLPPSSLPIIDLPPEKDREIVDPPPIREVSPDALVEALEVSSTIH